MARKIALSEETKSLLIVIAIALAALIISYNIFTSHINKTRGIKGDIIEERKKLILRKEVSKLDKLVNEYHKHLYNKYDVGSLRDTVSELAKDSGVEIVSIQTQESQKFGNYSKVSFAIKLRCNYNQLGRFIAEMEKLPKLVKINNLNANMTTNYEIITAPSFVSSGEEDTAKAFLTITTYYPEG